MLPIHRRAAATIAVLLTAPLAGQDPFALVTQDGEETAFATLHDALAAVVVHRRDGDAGDLTILVASGTHELASPIVVTPDCTSPKGRVVIAARPGARAVLSGGTRITKWSVAERDGRTVWTAALGASAKDLRELWIDGRRATLARHPDRGTLSVEAVPDADGEWTHGNFGFRFRAGDLDARAIGADVVVMSRWVESHLPVVAVDADQRLVRTQKRSVFRLEPGDPWYAEGSPAFLDQPGEFCIDRASGELRYLPRRGESPETVEATVPRLAALLRLDGEPEKDRWVDNVTFRDLAFHHAEWWFPADFRSNWPAPDAGGFSQAAILVPAAVTATGARSCAFTACEFAHLGGYAIELGRGCTGNVIEHGAIHDLGAGGIKIGETAIPAHAYDTNSANIVRDCDIGDGGHLFHSAIGVWIGQSPDNQVVHNAIHDFLYTGISVGWTWGYGPSAARGERIEGNRVHHIGVRADGTGPWLSDLGGIYTLGIQPGTVVAGNFFHDVAAFRYGGWGIYFDEGTSEVHAERNVVARTTHGGFHQHYGRDNVVDNNVFAEGRDAQVQRTRQEDHRSFSFTRNVVVWSRGELFAGNLSDLHFEFDHNVYWRTPPGEIRFGAPSFAQWQDGGMDRASRIADPGFVDPERDDFRLRDDSPARALGIASLDVRAAGPRAR